MRRRFFTLLAGMMAALILLLGCEKEEFPAQLPGVRDGVVADSVVEGMHGNGLNAVGLGNGDLLDEYVEHLRAFAYFSGALTLRPMEGGDFREVGGINPITASLQYDYAIDPSGKRQYDFFALGVEERADFYEQILQDEKAFLAERLNLEPRAAVVIRARSRALQRVLLDCVGDDVWRKLGKSGRRIQARGAKGSGGMEQELMAIAGISEQTMRMQSQKMLSELGREIDREYGGIDGGSGSGVSSGSKGDRPCDEKFAAKMRSVYRAHGVQRGQILYRGMWEGSSTGHAAILMDPDIPETGNICGHLLSIDAYPEDGVRDRTVQTWNYRHYVLGVRKIWYTWEKGWWIFKKRVRHEKKLYNMGGVADVAADKRGCPYGGVCRSKHQDDRFICSSLVWYSVKHGCSIDGDVVDLVAWRPNTIWPTDLWLDSKTFVVAEVRR